MTKMTKNNRQKLRRAALLLSNGFAGSFVLAQDCFTDQIDPSREPTLIIANPEQWLDVTLGNIECRNVRQRSFEPVADLDKHLPVFGEDEQHHAISAVLLPHAPCLRHTLRVIGYI